ncbi:hypothetical protein ACSBR1_043436 [Camellia fascicularis]
MTHCCTPPRNIRPKSEVFADSWISGAFTRDTKTLTKALQQSLSNYSSFDLRIMSPFFNLIKSETTILETVALAQSSGSRSDLKAAATTKLQNSTPVIEKPTKRKSQASKKNIRPTECGVDDVETTHCSGVMEQISGRESRGLGREIDRGRRRRCIAQKQGAETEIDRKSTLLPLSPGIGNEEREEERCFGKLILNR